MFPHFAEIKKDGFRFLEPPSVISISRNVIFTVRVWIAVLPPFESEPKQERLFRRAWYDILHDIAHLELYTQSMDRSDNIRIICDPCTSKAATLC